MATPPPSSAPQNGFHLTHCLVYGLLCLIWGSTWMAIRVLVRDVPPLWSAGVRFVIAAAILLLLAALRRSPAPQGPRQWRAVAVLGIAMIAFPYGLLFWAEQFVTSSMTAVLYTALPLCVAALTPWMSRHSVPRSAILSMVVGAGALVGASLAAERGLASQWTTHAVLALLFLAIAGSAVAFAAYYWLLRHMQPYQ